MRGNGLMGWGDMYKPSEGLDVVKASARTEFLDAIVRRTPRAIRSLEADVFPYYLALQRLLGTDPGDARSPDQYLGEMQGAEWTAKHGGRTEEAPALSAEERAYLNLYEALMGWQDRFRLQMEWLTLRVLAEFEYQWRDTMRSDDRLEMPFGTWWRVATAWSCPVDDEDCLFRFELEKGWNPTSEPWMYFEVELQKSFLMYANAYRKALVKHCAEHGFVQVPKMRKPERHFDMLALRIVGRRSYADIARKFGVTEPAAIKAIQGAARMGDIKLPESSPGRPKGRKSARREENPNFRK